MFKCNWEEVIKIAIMSDRQFMIQTKLNALQLRLVYSQMAYSDCKNQICVNDGQINKTNQSIVCLPNKVLVEIIGGEEEFDAVSN